MTAPDDKIKKLMRELAESCWNGWNLDGGEVQGMLEDAGVLVPIEMTSPCGEECTCAGVTDFPTTCYRLAEEWK